MASPSETCYSQGLSSRVPKGYAIRNADQESIVSETKEAATYPPSKPPRRADALPGPYRLTAMAILVRVGLGLVLLVVGIISVPTPVPIGAILIILALTLLLPTFEPVGRMMRHMRQRNRRLDRWMTAGARKGPKWIRQAWRSSSPRIRPRQTGGDPGTDGKQTDTVL